MRTAPVLLGLLLCCGGAQAQGTPAAKGKAGEMSALDAFPHKDTHEASEYRGAIVFANYCINCHGVNADGGGRAARIYNPKPSNLRLSMMPDAYKKMIVQRGGKAVGRSEFMPPWGEELTHEQIGDVVNYLRMIAPPAAPK